MEKKKYIIIEADDLWSLTERVNMEIENGYQPIGGIVKDKKYINSERYTQYLQAMIHNKLTENEN